MFNCHLLKWYTNDEAINRFLTPSYRNARANFGNTPEQKVLTSQMRRLLRDCPRGNFRLADILNQTFIFPGNVY